MLTVAAPSPWQVHEVSGALATANSRRLRTLAPGQERERAKSDVEADILTHVTLADKVWRTRRPPRARAALPSCPLALLAARASRSARVRRRLCRLPVSRAARHAPPLATRSALRHTGSAAQQARWVKSGAVCESSVHGPPRSTL